MHDFSSNHIRLSPREWLITLAIVGTLFVLLPRLWEHVEPMNTAPSHRISYSLSNDYWLFERWAREACTGDAVIVLGDSVMWGHYVSSTETLPHYLTASGGEADFRNLGVDGIHPAALSGLISYYGDVVANKKVLLHLNLLWMSSPRRDLQGRKEFRFNHPRLVPQFFPSIPCYTEPTSGRIGIVVERYLPLAGWAQHLRLTSFETNTLPTWTITHPYRNPFGAITTTLPAPDEPVSPPVEARPWTAQGLRPANFPWVELKSSFQWACFKRTIGTLRDRGNQVFVLLGPLNEHMLATESRARYKQLVEEAGAWLEKSELPHAVPAALPSETYADVSHPLAEGYALLSERLSSDPGFVAFLNAGNSRESTKKGE